MRTFVIIIRSTYTRRLHITIHSFTNLGFPVSGSSLHTYHLGAFKLYDVDNDGYITREEMYDIVGAIYEMLGSAKRPSDGLEPTDATSDESPNVRVDRIFELLDSVCW